MEMLRKCHKKLKKKNDLSRKCHKKRALFLGTSARVRHDETARNRRCDVKIGRSMPLGTLQDMGKTLTRPFDHRAPSHA